MSLVPPQRVSPVHSPDAYALPSRPEGTMPAVLDAYRQRYTTLRDAVMETEPAFDESVLGRVPVTDLLTRPIHDLAAYWQTREKIRSSSGEVLR